MISHRGKLKAEIQGKVYEFDGDVWAGPKGETLTELNDSMDYIPQSHIPIDRLAAKVLEFAGLNATRIFDVEHQELPPLPPGAVD